MKKPMIPKRMYVALLLLIFIPVCLYTNGYSIDDDDDINPAIKKQVVDSAEAWLKMIDNGNYKQSWEYTAEFFKKTVSKEQWIKSLQSLRKPLGKLLSRNLESNDYPPSLPNAPDGEYMMLQFSSSFKNKKATNEALLLFLDNNGKWQVCGYSVQ
jgi:hypothetical protein